MGNGRGQRTARKFSDAESFHLFLEGVRALQAFDKESCKHPPLEAVLKEKLLAAEKSFAEGIDRFPDDVLSRYYLGMIFTLHAQVEQTIYLRDLWIRAAFTWEELLQLAGASAAYLEKAVRCFKETAELSCRGDLYRYALYNRALTLAKMDEKSATSDSHWDEAKRILESIEVPGFKSPSLLSFAALEKAYRFVLHLTFSDKPDEENEALALQICMVDAVIDLRRHAYAQPSNSQPAGRLSQTEIPTDQHPQTPDDLRSHSPASQRLKSLLVREIQRSQVRGSIKKDIVADYWNKWAFITWERALKSDNNDERSVFLDHAERMLGFIPDDRQTWTPRQVNMLRVCMAQAKVLRDIQQAGAAQAGTAVAPIPAKSTASGKSLTALETEISSLIDGILGVAPPPVVPNAQSPAVDVNAIANTIQKMATRPASDPIAIGSNIRRSYPALSEDSVTKLTELLADKLDPGLIDQIFRQYAGCK